MRRGRSAAAVDPRPPHQHGSAPTHDPTIPIPPEFPPAGLFGVAIQEIQIGAFA
ncbi:hypothetical protein [Jiangella alba]|uniref:hypothetical protein n=1 Tax=Jiangella alba TaxID=561176 RepID=UPI0014961D39|nr:hypothetical protein [Jiangella alba]